ncbi:beta-lactamase family protein [Paenibacillus hamazuiensis]|uniref:beta-lactamase family protein n=1 Tax=Paenibacillus hamazuiensis TaxID=2936508 RepID=UPI0020101690|nr:beta-lactamase family protein [Paenibacillus hamazuiensis]
MQKGMAIGLVAALLSSGLMVESGVSAQEPTKVSNPFERPTMPLAHSNVPYGPNDSREVAGFLDEFFAKESIRNKIGAVSVSVVGNGQILAEKGYGVMDKSSQMPVDPNDSVFRIGSVSKVFTAAAILQLRDQGKLSLKDDVEKYLNGYKITNPYGTPVTIEMLLTHTTGFEVRDPTPENIIFDNSREPVALEEYIFQNFPPVVREPGTSYMYDNFAFDLQGYIVQSVSGQPFSDYMEERLFKPLGMNSSSFVMPEELANRIASTYDKSGNAIPFYRMSPGVIPSGSMISTSADMARFMNAFLNGGKTNDGTVILSPESVKAMSGYHISIHSQVPDATYGFEAPYPHSLANGQTIIAKSGDVPGFHSMLWLLPEQKSGFFISQNTDEKIIDDFIASFMDHYYPGIDRTFGVSGFVPQSISELKKFAGTYIDLRRGKLAAKVTVIGNGLLSAIDSRNVRHRFIQVDNYLFVDENGLPLAFKPDQQGNIAYLKYNSPVSYAAKKREASGFPDVPVDHPYAEFIGGLQSFGILEEDPSKPYDTQATVTREQFIHAIMPLLDFPASSGASTFIDIEHSPYKADIRNALEAGVVAGSGQDRFEPERPIRREEAAVIMGRLIRVLGVQPPSFSAEVPSDTEEWAIPGVQTVTGLKLHGPEVTAAGGRIDFGSQRLLNKQEMAAMVYLGFLLKTGSMGSR